MAVHFIQNVFPETVCAVFTDRLQGYSQPPYESYNLGAHVGDQYEYVLRNRRHFQSYLPAEPCWLTQVHGVHVVDAGLAKPETEADASFTRGRRTPCIIMTADCLPILLADVKGRCVAALHGGWRGLAAGIITKTIDAMGIEPSSLTAWLGPAIGADAFQVGAEVREVFVGNRPENVSAFRPDGDRYLADIKQIAYQQLQSLGVSSVIRHPGCTYQDSEHFFSYRRDGVTGRMAFAIWLE
ncbi:MAG: Polyphenol oxidase [Candidatus Celerinatantimonas neptuna]|nr:MAG: Polyphenol oxidase [Candidatus Celerinatantimonas neptuna]